jgi:hypothetical protein
MRLTVNGFAMWWHSVFRQDKFIDKGESCSFVQHMFVSHHIAKPMLCAVDNVVTLESNN